MSAAITLTEISEHLLYSAEYADASGGGAVDLLTWNTSTDVLSSDVLPTRVLGILQERLDQLKSHFRRSGVMIGTASMHLSRLLNVIAVNPSDANAITRTTVGNLATLSIDPTSTTTSARFFIVVPHSTTPPVVVVDSSGRSVFEASDYGAVGDGVTDDTAAIQRAIEACGAAGGGIVHLARGTYRIQPQASGEHCLYIRYDNVEIRGEGPSTTVLKAYVYGGGSPDGTTPGTNFEVINGAVHRGSGIFVTSDNVPARTGFTLRNLRLSGSAPREDAAFPIAGNGAAIFFPANPANGSGWDLTHKGVFFQENVAHASAAIIECEIDSWRGENVYYGGSAFDGLFIRDCLIRESNASMLSTAARLTVVRTTFTRGNAGYESGGIANQDQRFHDCYFYDNNIGLNITAGPGQVLGEHLVTGNVFRKNPKGHVWLNGGAARCHLHHNTFEDGGAYTETAMMRIFSWGGADPNDIAITHNAFIAHTESPESAIYLTGTPTRVLIDDNYVGKTAYALANGNKIGLFTRSDLASGADVKVRRNRIETRLYPGVNYESSPYIPLFEDNTIIGALIHQAVEIADGVTSARIVAEDMQVLGSVAGYNQIPTLLTGYSRDGQRSKVTAQDGNSSGYFPKTGAGHVFKAPRYLNGAVLTIEYNASAAKWYEISYEPADKSKKKLTANDVKLTSEALEAHAPTIQAYGCDELSLAPGIATSFNGWANFPEGTPVRVVVNANVTLKHNVAVANNLKLAGAADWAPGGTGGEIWLIVPKGSTAAYELYRVTY